MHEIEHLAQLIKEKNIIEDKIAAIIKRPAWSSAEIYPIQRNPDLQLSGKQREMLQLFGDLCL
jgi:hypothetical protein